MLCILFLMAFCFGITACKTKVPGLTEGGETSSNTLTIRHFNFGYGTEWLVSALESYKAEHEGFTYQLIPDSTITDTVTTYLKSGKNLSDIYMTQGGAWSEWVSMGYLANLDDIYQTKVQTSAGMRTIADYMDDELVSRFYMQKYVGQGEYLPWVLPIGSIGCSLIYNEEILFATPHTTADTEGKWSKGENWTAPPQTVDELLAYCTDLNARGITPLAWAGLESHWLKFLMYVWFAQYQGVHEENLLNVSEGDGSYYDFWNFSSADVWKMEGIQKAIETLQSIFVDKSAGGWKNTLGGVNEYTTQDAERQFVSGNTAMLLGGAFFYTEMEDYIEKDIFKMMQLPAIENAEKNEDGTVKTMTFYSTDEIMFVPAQAKNTELAKDFLAYLCSEENMLKFTQCSGTMRPFEYNAIELSGDDYKWNAFTKSVLTMYNDSDVRLYAYPAGKANEDVSLIYRYIGPDLEGKQVWETFLSVLKKLTPMQIMITGSGDYKSVYDVTAPEYEKWKIELGIE